MTVLELLAVYMLGAFGYGGIELLWRGRTHWSMLVTGGICFLCMYMIENLSRERRWRKYLMCTAVITTFELIAGMIVNLRMGWDVWDYSDMPLNLSGQICLGFSAAWLMLSIPGTALCRVLRRFILHKGLRPRRP